VGVRNWLPLPLALAVAWLAPLGCNRDAGESGTSAASASASAARVLLEAADDTESADGGAQKRGAVERAGERAKIPEGKLVAGSTPGDRGREPTLEPALLEVTLAAFEIDKLPYPNDPAHKPLTGIDRKRAASLCGERDGRLCTELEWERACKGADEQSYAGAGAWEASCAESPNTCASGFGVLAMGAALREWTASDVLPIKKLQRQAAAVRGARADAADVDHRCAHRVAVDPKAGADDLGFRCCYGERNEPTIPSPKWLATVRKVEMPPSRLQKMFGSNPRLKTISGDIKYFREESAAETVLRRGRAKGVEGDAGTPPPNTYLTASPIIWSPVPGEEILLVTGRSNKDSFIVAFHRLPDDRYRVGSAMIMEGELGPVVLIYNPYVRRKLHWATCWECYGETGNITYRTENRVTITQK